MSDSTQGYAHPSALVETHELEALLQQPDTILIESNEDILLYDTGHIPGAHHIDWRRDLNDQLTRDYIAPEAFAQLASKHGITPGTTIIFYGDKSNWWAAYALWVFQLLGHTKTKLLNGGRAKWIAEERPLTRALPPIVPSEYPLLPAGNDHEIRAFYEQALLHANSRLPLIDVRSPREFSGEVTHMPEYPQEGVLRGGHIPGARSIPWATASNPDGTFKSADDLRKIYQTDQGMDPEDDVITYCRIGERSSHTWFVLKYLLGFNQVRNYDGSWTEWGNRVRSPIER